jgi:hypothetical protein
MKKTILFIFLVSISALIYSQDHGSNEEMMPKNTIGIYSNIGICQPLRFTTMHDNVTPHGKETYSFGLKYLRSLSNKFGLEMSLCYSKYNIRNHLIIDTPLPINESLAESFRTITIPILLRRYYPKNYFISFGTLIDFGLSRKGNYLITDTQTGFGLIACGGKEFRINKYSLDIGPNTEIHSLIPFSSKKNQQRLFVIGLKASLNFKIN